MPSRSPRTPSAPSGDAPSQDETAPNVQRLVATLSCAGIVVALMQTLVIPLIADLPQLLHTRAANTSWVITSTLLAGAVATPIFGRLGDMHGKRRMLMVSVGLMVLGSVVCGLSDNLTGMVIGRALQGVSIGVIPLGISIMRDEVPPARLGSAMALMSSSLGVGGALGLPISAVIAQHANWHVLFWAAAGLGLAVLALIAVVVPESPVRGGGHFDVPGAFGLTAGLLCFLLPISKGGDWGWGSATTLGFFAASAAILAAWTRWELRIGEPLVDLRTSTRRQVLLTNLASILVGFSFYAMQLVFPQILQLPKQVGYGLGLSMVAAGFCLAPSGLVMMLISPVSARLSASRGPKISLAVGALLLALGYAISPALLHAPWQIIASSCVVAGGIAIGYAAMPALIMTAVPRSETAAANGLNTLMRQIGTSTSSALVGVVLAHMTTKFGARVVPSLTGFRTVLIVAAVAGLLAAGVTMLIPGRRTATVPAPSPEPDPTALPSPVSTSTAAPAQETPVTQR